MPARQWPRIQQSLEEIIPLAGQALLAAFQESLGAEVMDAMRDGLGGMVADDDEDDEDDDAGEAGEDEAVEDDQRERELRDDDEPAGDEDSPVRS